MAHNVKLRPGSNYTGVIGVASRWLSHVFIDSAAPTGARPQSATQNQDDFVAKIKCGQVYYGDPEDDTEKLTVGGLFSELGNNGRAIVIEDYRLPGITTFDLVDCDGNTIRTIDTSTQQLPFVIAPYEYIKLDGGTQGEDFKFLARLEGTRIL